MPVKFYIHTELPNDGKERLALYRTARALHNEYRHANDLYILIANLDRTNNLTRTDLTQLDALLLGPRFIAILEFKNCFEPIIAADLNKPWYVDKGAEDRVMLGKRDRNPFQQVEDARRRWANFLQATASDYLSSRRARELENAWLHLSACILFHPYLHRRSSFPPLGEASYWCHIGGIDEIIPFTQVMRSSILDFTAAEQLALADKVFFAHPWDEMEKSFQGILGYLRVWEGEQSTGRFPVFRHDQIIIGRSSLANGPHISHKADLVSGVHALIESDNERVCVRDLDSTNGTYLDNEQLQDETTKYLSAEKKLILASSGSRGCQLRFEKVTESRTSATIHKIDETVTE
jgi:hypothetical protein